MNIFRNLFGTEEKREKRREEKRQAELKIEEEREKRREEKRQADVKILLGQFISEGRRLEGDLMRRFVASYGSGGLANTLPDLSRLSEIGTNLQGCGSAAVEPLCNFLRNNVDLIYASKEAIFVLGNLGDKRAIPAIKNFADTHGFPFQDVAKEALKKLESEKETPATPEPKTTWQLPNPSNEEEYVLRCLHAEFNEQEETRTFRSDPTFASVLTALNSQQYAEAIKAGQAILPRFPDLDLIYKWLGKAYSSTQQLSKSRDILNEGLGKAKRKCILLTDMGETEWQSGKINEAVYWWSQALHCLSSNPIDYNVYLLLSYVAKGLGLADFEQSLLARVDSLQGGQVRLDPATAGRLTSLVQNKKTEAMQRVLKGLQSKYFATD